MFGKIRNLMKGKRGQGMSEYIIMLALVGIAGIGIYTAFGDQVREAMDTVGNQLQGDTTAEQTLDADLAAQSTKEVTLGDFGNDE